MNFRNITFTFYFWLFEPEEGVKATWSSTTVPTKALSHDRFSNETYDDYDIDDDDDHDDDDEALSHERISNEPSYFVSSFGVKRYYSWFNGWSIEYH